MHGHVGLFELISAGSRAIVPSSMRLRGQPGERSRGRAAVLIASLAIVAAVFVWKFSTVTTSDLEIYSQVCKTAEQPCRSTALGATDRFRRQMSRI
jgi:hypothetical protein